MTEFINSIIDHTGALIGWIIAVLGLLTLVIAGIKKLWDKYFVGKITTKHKSQIEKNTKELENLRKAHDRCSSNMAKTIMNGLKKEFQEIKDRNDKEFQEIKDRLDESERKYKEGSERSELIFEIVEANLGAHIENGSNGKTQKVQEKLNIYYREKSSK